MLQIVWCWRLVQHLELFPALLISDNKFVHVVDMQHALVVNSWFYKLFVVKRIYWNFGFFDLFSGTIKKNISFELKRIQIMKINYVKVVRENIQIFIDWSRKMWKSLDSVTLLLKSIFFQNDDRTTQDERPLCGAF